MISPGADPSPTGIPLTGAVGIRKGWFLLSELPWKKQTSPSAPSTGEAG
jgi:hypothetical protein